MFREVLAANVKHLRSDRNMSQEQLAAEAGISVRYYQHIEAATKTPSVKTIFKIAKALDTDYNAILLPAWQEWLEPSSLTHTRPNQK